jgi:hypothetical protein
MKTYEAKLEEVREFRYALMNAVQRLQSFVDDERIYGEKELQRVGRHSPGALESHLMTAVSDVNNAVRPLQSIEQTLANMLARPDGSIRR